nr:TauD/TfdA family dioxygenase [Bradyrhizobium manausense]
MLDLGSIEPRQIPALRIAGGSSPGCFAPLRLAVKELLVQRGFALLRNTGVIDAESFSSTIAELGIATAVHYGDLPDEGWPGVFRTTQYPPSESIFFHSEASHMARAPRLIAFGCIQPALAGGATPLSDNFLALSTLRPEISRALQSEGLCYERAFIPGLDVLWQNFFRTDDRAKAMERGIAEGLTLQWDNDDVLCTVSRRPATLSRANGQSCLFQQIALHHPVFLDPDLRTEMADICGGRMPRNVTLGSGAPLPDSWAIAIHDSQCRAAFTFSWESGDVLIVDNVRTSHARAPFVGPRHHIVMVSPLSANLSESEINI